MCRPWLCTRNGTSCSIRVSWSSDVRLRPCRLEGTPGHRPQGRSRDSGREAAAGKRPQGRSRRDRGGSEVSRGGQAPPDGADEFGRGHRDGPGPVGGEFLGQRLGVPVRHAEAVPARPRAVRRCCAGFGNGSRGRGGRVYGVRAACRGWTSTAAVRTGSSASPASSARTLKSAGGVKISFSRTVTADVRRERRKKRLSPRVLSWATRYHWPKRLPRPHGSTRRSSSLPVLPAR